MQRVNHRAVNHGLKKIKRNRKFSKDDMNIRNKDLFEQVNSLECIKVVDVS